MSWNLYTLLPDASLSLLVRFLGVEVDVLAETLADEFNPGPKRLHLCISRPCVDPSDEPKLHVTKIRVWAEADFVQAQLYVKDTMLKMIPAWQKLIKSGRGKGAKPGESGKETKEPQKKRRGDGQAKPKATPKRGGPPRKRRDPKADSPKERVRAGGLQSNEHEEDEQCEGEEEEKERQRDNEGESGCWPYARHSSFSNEDTVGHWGPSRGSGGVGGGKRRHFEELEDPVSFEGSGTGTFGKEEEEGQEIQKSHEENLKVAGEGVVFKERVVDKEEKEKEEKADVEEWGDRKLQHELIKLLGGIDRGEVRGGAIEAPLRRKSKERPGSVLALLTSHVAQQLDQGALVDMEGEDQGVVSGVKIMTYFNLFLKPHYTNHQRELRELHSLAAMIDILRQGDLAKVGDALSGRFIALHQFLQDGSWNTARHMELYPMDEGHAASPVGDTSIEEACQISPEGARNKSKWIMEFALRSWKRKREIRLEPFRQSWKGKGKRKEGKRKREMAALELRWEKEKRTSGRRPRTRPTRRSDPSQTFAGNGRARWFGGS
eukprot:symbB.v1.2.039303.t1/scaffold6471.1/size17862/1